MWDCFYRPYCVQALPRFFCLSICGESGKKQFKTTNLGNFADQPIQMRGPNDQTSQLLKIVFIPNLAQPTTHELSYPISSTVIVSRQIRTRGTFPKYLDVDMDMPRKLVGAVPNPSRPGRRWKIGPS